MAGPCGGEYYACQMKALIEDWRLEFINSPADACVPKRSPPQLDSREGSERSLVVADRFS